jgi:hypothetical protein
MYFLTSGRAIGGSQFVYTLEVENDVGKCIINPMWRVNSQN